MSEKETFQTAVEAQLGQWKGQIEIHSKKIEELKAKAEELEKDAKLQYLEQIKELENKIDGVKTKMAEAEQRFEQIKDAGEEAWEEIKTGSQNAWDDLSLGITLAWKEVKNTFGLASSKLQDGIPKK